LRTQLGIEGNGHRAEAYRAKEGGGELGGIVEQQGDTLFHINA